MTVSSVSERSPLSKDAVKLLDISGSETRAYEDCVEAVDVVDVVRSRGGKREARGSSCQTELEVSMFPYSLPCIRCSKTMHVWCAVERQTLMMGCCPRTPATR